MHSRYFRKPYEFVPPYHGTFWTHLARPVLAAYLRRKYRIQRVEARDIDRLQRSFDAGAGILLAPNHCQMADPFVVGQLRRRLKRFCYYVASFHVFQGTRLYSLTANRLGAFSILRDAPDRRAFEACVESLATADRPVVMFPEGTYYRQNDRVGPVRGGVATVCHRAVRKSERPIVIHPVAIKYWFLEDPRPELIRRIEALERHFGWRPQRHLPLAERLKKTYEAYLVLQELEFLGQAQAGDLAQRIDGLCDRLLTVIEERHGVHGSGTVFERINALRLSRVRRMAEVADQKDHFPLLCQELDDLYLCQTLFAHLQDHGRGVPTDEQLAETLQRIEEDLFDCERPVAATGAVVDVGEPLDVRKFQPDRAGNEALNSQLHDAMQVMLDRLVQKGPPKAWRWQEPASSISPMPAQRDAVDAMA